MLRQIFTNKHENRPTASSAPCAVNVAAPQDENRLKEDIDYMYGRSRSGMWGLLIFLAASAVAFYFRKYTLAGIMSDNVMEWLGPTPDVILVNIVLGFSTASSLIIIAGRIYNDHRPSRTWTHLSFRVFFYLLYFISGSLNEYFNVVFISGLVVLALQHCNVWNYYLRAIENKLSKFENLFPYDRGFSQK